MEYMGRVQNKLGTRVTSWWRCSNNHQNVHAYGGAMPYQYGIEVKVANRWITPWMLDSFIHLDECMVELRRLRLLGAQARVVHHGYVPRFIKA